MQLIKKKLTEIKPYKRNPRINDNAVEAVKESIRQCEYVAPIVVDENGVILAGHTRYKALQEMGVDEIEVCVKSGLTEEQKKKYRILDNKTAELADWDFDLLAQELDGLDFEGFDFGFDFDLGDEKEKEIIEDEPPEVDEDKEPMCKLGDIWQLGNNRLMCGDSTDREQVERLMNGEKADMVFTDPPYNVAIGSKNKVLNENNHKRKGHRIEQDIENDKGMTDEEIGESIWKPAFVNLRDFSKDCCSIYVTMPQGGSHMMMMMMMMSAAWQVKHEIIWVKNQPTFSMGRLDYDYQHEPICYGWNKSHVFYGKGKYNKSIWNIDKPRESKLHPTMKPIELISNAILNSSKENDLIIDFFGGSGSTLIACEQLGRKCYMVELDPKYCDVILQRWEQFTGKKAVKVNG